MGCGKARMRFVLTILASVILSAGPLFALPLTTSVDSRVSAPLAPASPLTQAVKWLALGAGAVGITIRKDTGTLAQKFVTRAGAAAGDYKDGVTNAGPAWQTGASNGEGNYETGVQAAIANKMYAKGVQSAGPQKYVNNAVNLGSQRYGPGVANAKDAWAKGVQPYLDVLKSLNLPAKGARRSPQNQQRAAAVATALAAAKVGH